MHRALLAHAIISSQQAAHSCHGQYNQDYSWWSRCTGDAHSSSSSCLADLPFAYYWQAPQCRIFVLFYTLSGFIVGTVHLLPRKTKTIYIARCAAIAWRSSIEASLSRAERSRLPFMSQLMHIYGPHCTMEKNKNGGYDIKTARTKDD